MEAFTLTQQMAVFVSISLKFSIEEHACTANWAAIRYVLFS